MSYKLGDRVVLANRRFGTNGYGIYTVIHVNSVHSLYELCSGWCGYDHHLRYATPKEIEQGFRDE